MQADEGLVEYFHKIKRVASGQWVINRNDQHQSIAPIGLGFQPAQAALGSNDANFNLPGRNRLDNGRTRLLFQTDANARVIAQKIAKILRQKTIDGIGVGKNRNLAVQPAGVRRQIRVHLFELGENLPRMPQ